MIRFLRLVGLLLLAGAGCHKKTVDPTPGCQLTASIDTETWTYQFDPAGRLIHIARHTTSHDLIYAYAYQGNQATVDITYPQSAASFLRFHYDMTLNEQGYVLTAQQTQYNTLADGTENALLIYRHNCTYDAQGYLTTHHVDRYTYPSTTAASQQLTQTTDAQISYQAGNPVAITYLDTENKRMTSSSTTLNQYGTQVNSVKLAFLLEANPFGYTPDPVLQPLLGKPARTLITSAELTGTTNMTTRYTYRTNASGQLVEASRAGNAAPFTISLDTTCP